MAAIASYFYVEAFHLPKAVADRIITQSKMMLDKHSLSQVIDGSPGIEYRVAEKAILDALDETIDHLHWVGHNVICWH